MIGPRDLSATDMMNEHAQRAELVKQLELAPLFKYLELLLKITITNDTLSMNKYRLNRVMNEIEKKLGLEDNNNE